MVFSISVPPIEVKQKPNQRFGGCFTNQSELGKHPPKKNNTSGKKPCPHLRGLKKNEHPVGRCLHQSVFFSTAAAHAWYLLAVGRWLSKSVGVRPSPTGCASSWGPLSLSLLVLGSLRHTNHTLLLIATCTPVSARQTTENNLTHLTTGPPHRHVPLFDRCF